METKQIKININLKIYILYWLKFSKRENILKYERKKASKKSTDLFFKLIQLQNTISFVLSKLFFI